MPPWTRIVTIVIVMIALLAATAGTVYLAVVDNVLWSIATIVSVLLTMGHIYILREEIRYL